MHYLNLFTTALSTLFILGFTARLLYFLQLKEYRFDRFTDFIKNEKGFTKMIPLPYQLFYLATATNFYWQNSYLLSIVLLVVLLFFTTQVFKKGFFRPVLTMKAKLIYAITIILSLALQLLEQAQASELSILLNPLLLALAVVLFMPITKFAKERKIKQARLKRESFKNLKVIGITGSFGKSSTKEFLYHLLKKDFKTLQTPEHINTDIGVAQHILRNLNDQQEIYIVEMGAYRLGEIQNICKMVHPEIGIITAVAPQHLSLFKSLENIKNTKAELVRGLPENGYAVINKDFPETREIIESLSVQVDSYTKEQVKDHSFTLNKQTFTAKLEANFLITNLMAAVLVAQKLGLSTAIIQNRINTLPKEISPIKITKTQKLTIIDDSYNSNPYGFQQAIQLAKETSAKTDILSTKTTKPASITSQHEPTLHPRKILITRGMIELGERTYQEHLKIAKQADQVFDEIILTHSEIMKPFQEKVNQAKLSLIPDSKDLKAYLESNLQEGDLILIENKLNPLVYNYLHQF